MSDTIATYSFLPWLRQGVANKITANDLDAAVKLRATIDVQLKIDGKGVENGTLTETVDKAIQLYGPGDIIGLDKKAIVKNEPRNWITNFEPNYLPYIEFYDEDLPWRYTPAAPNTAKDRLRPWMTLVVLKEDEFTDGSNMKDRPLSYINVNDAASTFPAATGLWAWAHVHVNEGLMDNIKAGPGDKATVLENFQNVLAKNPDLAYSRIVCPRKLEPSAAYHAFLVPTFETGRLAGVGADPAIAPHATFSAWDGYPAREQPTEYPYYHRWFFRTGTIGDFEYLVRLLEPKPVDSRVGIRPMDVQNPGSNIAGISDPALEGLLKLGGALRIPYDSMQQADKDEFDKYENWVSVYPHPFQADLAEFVNLPDDYSQLSAPDANSATNLDPAIQNDPDPLITAPIYGRWHAFSQRLLKDRAGNDLANNENWVHELNLDPRFRVPAGFGTKVVQENQEMYMNAAWKQVGDILEANRKMRQAQLAKETSYIWHKKYFEPLAMFQPQQLLFLAAPAQRRVLMDGTTVYHHINTSKVPRALLSTPMRSITRPGGRLMTTLQFDDTVRPNNLIDRVNEGEVVPAPPKVVSPELPTIDQLAEDLAPNNAPGFIVRWIRSNKKLRFVMLLLGIVFLLLAIVFLLVKILPLVIVCGVIGILFILLFLLMSRWRKQLLGADSIKEENQTPESVDDMTMSPDFRVTFPGDSFNPSQGTSDSVEATKYKIALKEALTLIQVSTEAGAVEEKPKLDLAAIVNTTIQVLNPEITIPKMIFGSIYIPDRIKLLLAEEFIEAMAYPEFDTPMYKPLVDVSTELFLPNINLIGQNTISLLETNQRFIEAYMVGLNHEFARELLWREYPTDQRGSYFRQFWDVSSFYDTNDMDPEELKEKLRDIPPLHKWSRSSNLGDHDHREEDGGAEEEVVLVIRGELLKKYPSAVIYAHKARWQLKPNGDIDITQERLFVELEGDELNNPPTSKVKTPLYEAKVDPDITFFGFDLTTLEAQGGDGTDPDDIDNAGWFFVIKERPGEPRFGLDLDSDATPNVWNDLSWDDVQPGAPGTFIEIDDTTPTITLVDPELPGDQEKVDQHADDVSVSWNKDMNSAELAYILYQVPVLVGVHAAEMLPPQ